MAGIGLTEQEVALIRGVLGKHSAISKAILFGSRAKGTAAASSDVDLALEGTDDPLQAEAIARELDDLPLPYRFDVKALATIEHIPLREHIERVGIVLYKREPKPLAWQVAERPVE
ncbi:MAG: nucleotidyltransferase domain-containing protein [Kiritimatiellia bacterium]